MEYIGFAFGAFIAWRFIKRRDAQDYHDAILKGLERRAFQKPKAREVNWNKWGRTR